MNFINDCIEIKTDKKIKCEENHRKIIFNNPNRIKVKKILVDNCQITSGKRCDYLVIYQSIENFIELKGSDISIVFKQLKETIKVLGNDSFQRNSYIISSRSPLSSPQIQNERLKFKRKYKSKLIIKNNEIKININ